MRIGSCPDWTGETLYGYEGEGPAVNLYHKGITLITPGAFDDCGARCVRAEPGVA